MPQVPAETTIEAHKGLANGKGTTVTRADFVKDPGRYVDQARNRGPVTITDARGKPRIMIVVPRMVVGYDDA